MTKTSLLCILALTLLLTACATRSGYVRTHPDMDRTNRDALLNGEVRPGFDKDMVHLAKGKPTNITTNTTKDAVQEVWLYPTSLWLPLFGTIHSEFTYIYFEDGIVSKIRVVSGSEKYRNNIEKATGN